MTFYPQDRSNDPKAPIVWGRAKNFFQKVTVSNVSSFNTDCDVTITFTTQGVQFINLTSGASHIVEYSFDGNTVHGELDANNTNTVAKTFNPRVVSKIWFRVQTASTGPVTVSVEAWATMGG